MQSFCWLASRVVLAGFMLLLSACAGYSGSDLKPGVATGSEVVASMGEPAMRWKEPDGREQLAYPRGPAGLQTFMVYLGADGRLERIEGVLDNAHFGRIVSGKTDQAAVLRILGPSQPQWTIFYKQRDDLVWSWRFCDLWGEQAKFDVHFDATTGIVRTYAQYPDLLGFEGIAPSCGRSAG